MQNFQSQVLDPQTPADKPFEVLLTAEEHKKLGELLPLMISLSNATKVLRNAAKKPVLASLSTEVDLGYNDKRPAYKQALNKISNSNGYLARCAELLAAVRRHPKAGPFLQPVDPIAEGVPDYLTIITEPMDLATMQNKLSNKEYATAEEFDADMQKMLNNALLYNKPGTFVNKIAEELKSYYEKISADKSGSGTHSHKKGGKASRGYDSDRQKNKQKQMPLSAQPLTFTEMQKLSEQILEIPPVYLKDVFNIISQEKGTTNDLLEFGLHELPPKVARELQAFVNQKINLTLKKKKNRSEDSTRGATRPDAELPETSPPLTPPPAHALQRPAGLPHYIEESSSSSLLDSISDDSI